MNLLEKLNFLGGDVPNIVTSTVVVGMVRPWFFLKNLFISDTYTPLYISSSASSSHDTSVRIPYSKNLVVIL